MEEDPTLSYVNNAETHQQIIGGLGEQHLDVVKAKLKEQSRRTEKSILIRRQKKN